MYIIIVGGGRVGASLSLELTELGHEVLVIERAKSRCDQLREGLGSVVMQGDGCETATLAEAGAERADVFIAVTDGDEDNLVSCQVAQHYFHVRHVIARVNTPRNERIFKLLGIERTVNAVEALTKGVLLELPERSLTRLIEFKGNGLVLMGVRIPHAAPSVGKSVAEVQLPKGSAIALIVQRDHMPHLPTRDVTLQPDDEVLVLARQEDEGAVMEALAGLTA